MTQSTEPTTSFAELGRMILLNGTSSSGKTSLARALQAALLPEIWLHMDVDFLRDAHPDRYLKAPHTEAKAAGMKALMAAIPDTMATLLRHGNNLIVDDCFGPAQLKNYVETLSPTISPLFVGVRCDVAELDRRETERGDRPRGTARGLLKSVFTPGIFDLEVETTHQSPESAAGLVIDRLRNGSKSDAFARLSRMDLAQIVEDSQVRWGEITFHNQRDADVLVYLIDLWEQRQLKQTVPPGETHIQRLSNLYPCEVCTQSGIVLTAFTPDGRDRIIELT